MMEFSLRGARPIDVYYDSWMDGGGTWFGQEYVEIVQSLYPGKCFDRAYEWCSGPGFIGFSLLSHGLCRSVCFSDRFEPAIQAIQHTAKQKRNQCEGLISAYASDTVSALPSTEKFDLVVANPPHYLECPGDDNYQRIAVDRDWAAHQEFFQNIGSHLAQDGVILLQENKAGSLRGAAEFDPFIRQNGLHIRQSFASPRFFDVNGPTQIYYIEIIRA